MYIIVYTETFFGVNGEGKWESGSESKELELKNCVDEKQAIKQYKREKQMLYNRLAGFGNKANRRYEFFQLLEADKKGKRTPILPRPKT